MNDIVTIHNPRFFIYPFRDKMNSDPELAHIHWENNDSLYSDTLRQILEYEGYIAVDTRSEDEVNKDEMGEL
jgi:hypothetical protein